jgi:hypothetical protein
MLQTELYVACRPTVNAGNEVFNGCVVGCRAPLQFDMDGMRRAPPLL